MLILDSDRYFKERRIVDKLQRLHLSDHITFTLDAAVIIKTKIFSLVILKSVQIGTHLRFYHLEE